jgi:hypothetical protein
LVNCSAGSSKPWRCSHSRCSFVHLLSFLDSGSHSGAGQRSHVGGIRQVLRSAGAQPGQVPQCVLIKPGAVLTEIIRGVGAFAALAAPEFR